jgi:hypothetical protein
VGFVAAVALEHVLVPGLDPLTHQISEYANARAGWLMTAGFIAWAVSFAALAAREPAQARGAGPVRLLLACCLAGAMLVAAFRTQTSAGALPAGTRLATEGRLHDLGGELITIGVVGAAAITAVRAGRSSYRRHTIALLTVAAAATIGLLIAGPPVAGLRQRVVVGTSCLWQVALWSRQRREPG